MRTDGKQTAGLCLTWLGQSGFLLQENGVTLACDLYLSDFCKKKSRLDHTRKMAIPIEPSKLPEIGHYLITHGHIDHFDPETVGPVLRRQSATRFYAPPVCRKTAEEYFPDDLARFHWVSSGKPCRLTSGVELLAVPAAHEELEKDSTGEYIAFSYLVLLAQEKKAVFFGGDTIPFAGQAELILHAVPGGYGLTMVLPVNGRDVARATLGFKGNLTLAEAAALAAECGAETLVPCHWGMFALNDLPRPPEFRDLNGFGGQVVIPQVGVAINI